MRTKPSNNPPASASRRLVSFLPLEAEGGKGNQLIRFEITASLMPDPGPSLPGNTDKDLLDLWHKVKRSIREHDIRSHQVTKWFEAVYHTSVSLVDFDRDLPPAKLTRERLAHFYRAIKRHTASSE